MGLAFFPRFTMKHDVEKILQPDTRIQTSVVSYLYECPVCKSVRRHAYPRYGQGVFCDGHDFRMQKRSDGFVRVLARKILRYLNISLIDIKQIGTKQHVQNLAMHYRDTIIRFEFLNQFFIIEEGEMFSFRDMPLLWALEDDKIVQRIEGARYKMTPLGMNVLSYLISRGS